MASAKRGAAQLYWIDTQQQMVHDRIAYQHNFQHIFWCHAGLLCPAFQQLLQALANRFGHLCRPAFIHQPIGNAAHQIFTKADLRIHNSGCGQHFACIHIA